jgi:TonB-dependent receptor
MFALSIGLCAPAYAQQNSTDTVSPSAPVAPKNSSSSETAPSPDSPTAGNATTTTTTQAGQPEGGAIVITGIRGSLRSAQAIKRNAPTIVDSIVAEDIAKLPDNNATEALQRITGVQVSRDVGEGGAIAIRGLPQVETTLNGRETFTAGGGRSFNLEDLPAELISRIDVYKAPTADLIEGGLGGLVDIRTRLPFDFRGFTASATARGIYSDLRKKWEPQASALLSDRWNTGIGEIGILGAISYQKRAYRQDIDSTGAPTPRIPGTAGQIFADRTVFAPNGNYQVLVTGVRERIGANAALQWRPSPNLEFNLEGQYQHFKTTQQQYSALIPTAGSPVVPGSATVFPGTDDIEQASYTNQVINAGGTERDLLDVNKQIALNGKWTSGGLTLGGDIAYTKSSNDLVYTELDLVTHAPVFTQFVGTNPPSSSTTGIDLSDIANYTVGGLTRNENHFVGHEWAGRLDGEYKFEGSFLSAIDVGIRHADRTVAQQNPLRYFAQTTSTNPASYPGLFEDNGFFDFYTKKGNVDFQRDYPHADPSQLRNNFDSVLDQLGLTGVRAPSTSSINSQLAQFSADEKTFAAYAMAKFGFNAGVPIDGNIGVRYVRTEDSIEGNQLQTTQNANGIFVPVVPNAVEPVSVRNNYSNVLPSVNVRAHLTDKLQMRFAASETLTRPDFSQLSPAVTVVPGQLAASSGNPSLQPIKSKNADLSLEWYFSHTGSLYGALFYKKVNGFIFTRATPNVTIGGISGYTVSQPSNSGTGTVKGAEVGYQQFFDFLPGPLSGFGVQANFTYAQSQAPTSLVGFSAPLTGLSKYSYNLAAMYEKYGISARLAYNYRSSFQSSILAGAYTPPGGTTIPYVFPVFTAGYGWLDASLNYDVTPNVTLTADAQNLLRTQIHQYYEVSTRPGQFTIDDRQFMIGARIKF